MPIYDITVNDWHESKRKKKEKEKKERIADNSDFWGFFIISNTEIRITWHMLLNVYYDTINEQIQNNKINIYTFITLNYSLPWRCS
jgi:patatin-like phospholipase/acyl hydrolase